ncbi:TonB-dependent siderophore receptor [uncultured Megasphaera sp.]|uniref:TonB-dependent receptor plug domain-containing protein n=1 Tax=uncultured Megasphaera sp. TaxID=165188 RepID=UPI00262ACEFC|nr:TonB-dependent receptor [uncultured Megasphaera sp.]
MTSHKTLLSLICLSLAGSIPVGAAAAEADTDTIVVTADRYQPVLTAQALQEKQSNTAVITAEDLERNQYIDVQTALEQVNGVTVTEQVPGTSAYIRLNGDDRVLVLVDGQPITNPQSAAYGRGTVDLQTLPGVDHIERIEVTKGSGSVRYGSGAVGGVVNIITKRGGQNRTTLDVNTGSWGTHNYSLTTSGSSGNTSWYVTGSLGHRKYYQFNDDGYDTDESRGDYNKDSLTARIDQRLNDSSSLTFWATHTNFQGHGSTFDDSDEQPGLQTITANKRIERLNNNYSLTYTFGEDGDTPGFIRYFNNYSKNLWTYHFHSRYQGVQAENSWKLGDHNVLTAGVEWTKDEGTNAEVGYVDKERTNRALYLENVMTFGKLNITPGVRLDDNSEFGYHKTPRIAMNYQPNEKWNVYANWSRVFAAPKLNDLYYYLQSSSGKESYGNPNLKPETGYTQNIGVTYQYDEKTQFNVNFFRSSISNAIRWYRTPSYSEVENVNKEKKTGVEISMSKSINEYWDYELGYSYIHTKVDKGDGAGMNVDNTFNRPNGYHAGLHFHNKAWKVNMTMNAGTGRDDDYYMHGSYVTWDLGVSYDVTKDFTVYAQVNNLTNEGYDMYHDYPSAGRFWLAGAKYSF